MDPITMKDVWRTIEAGGYCPDEDWECLAVAHKEARRLEAEFRADLAAAIGSEARVPPWVASALSDFAWRERESMNAAWDLADDIIAALTTEEPARE
jgi:hypothetical protein